MFFQIGFSANDQPRSSLMCFLFMRMAQTPHDPVEEPVESRVDDELTESRVDDELRESGVQSFEASQNSGSRGSP